MSVGEGLLLNISKTGNFEERAIGYNSVYDPEIPLSYEERVLHHCPTHSSLQECNV